MVHTVHATSVARHGIIGAKTPYLTKKLSETFFYNVWVLVCCSKQNNKRHNENDVSQTFFGMQYTTCATLRIYYVIHYS